MTKYEREKEQLLDEYLASFEEKINASGKISRTVSFATAKLVMDAFQKGFDAGLKSKITKTVCGSPPTQYHEDQ